MFNSEESDEEPFNTAVDTTSDDSDDKIDNQYLRDYNNMHRQIEDKQNEEYYKAQRQIHSAIMGDTPVKTVHNRQYIDNISAYDSENFQVSVPQVRPRSK